MKTHVFLIFNLALCLGWVGFYSSLKDFFRGEDKVKTQLHQAHKNLEAEELKAAYLAYQLKDFEQSVAAVLPGEIKKRGKYREASFGLRNIASVVLKSESDQKKIKGSTELFKLGKQQFRKKNFNAASRTFKLITDHYSYSAYVVESYFLLAESLFLVGQYERAIKVIEKMVHLFPENELTGLSMVRLGKIFEYQERREEAVDIYKVVINSFPQRAVSSQAVQSLKAVEF